MNMFDAVMPKGNETELIKMAEMLGITELMLVYEGKIPEGDYKTAINIVKAKYSEEKPCLLGNGNRVLVENKNVKYHTNLEVVDKKDKTHYRMTQMNQVIAKIMKEKKKEILFNFSLLKEDKGVILGRMMQNARLAKKYGVKTRMCSFAKTPYEMRSLKDLEVLKGIL